MAMDTPKAKNIDEYIAAFPPEAGGTENYDQKGSTGGQGNDQLSNAHFYPPRQLGSFCGLQNHIGFYPSASGIENFRKELSAFKSSKRAVQFLLDQPIPYDLITKMVKFKVKENLEKAE